MISGSISWSIANGDHRRVFAYLQKRGIAAQVIRGLIDSGLLHPNLSEVEVSLVPKTVNDKGRTLTLDDGRWASAESIDGEGGIATHYTATFGSVETEEESEKPVADDPSASADPDEPSAPFDWT